MLPVKNAAHAHGTKTMASHLYKAWTLSASTDLQMPLDHFNKARFQKLHHTWCVTTETWEHGAGSSSCHKVPAVSCLFSWTKGPGADGIHDRMV